MKKVPRLIIIAFLSIFTPHIEGEFQTLWADQMPEEIRALHESLKNAQPAYTLEQANAYAAKLMPLVEKAAGRRFINLPEIRLVGAVELRKTLAREFVAQIENRRKDWKRERILKEADDNAATMSPCSLGMYSSLDKAVCLVPSRIDPMLKLLELDKQHTDAIINLHIVHELTHALQDQHIGLGKRMVAIESREAMEAFLSTIEGHAVFIQEKVGQELQLERKVMEAFLNKASGEIKFKDPILRIKNRMAMTVLEIRYLGGKGFIEHHYSIGGNEKVWQVLSTPPQDTAMIVNPSAYSPANVPAVDLSDFLEGLDKHFTGENKTTLKSEHPKTGLSLLSFLGPDSRKEVVSQLRSSQTLDIYSNNNLIGRIDICFLNNETYGPELIGFFISFEEFIHNYFKENVKGFANKLILDNFKTGGSDSGRQMKEFNAAGDEILQKVFFSHKKLAVIVTSYKKNGSNLLNHDIQKVYSDIVKRYDAI